MAFIPSHGQETRTLIVNRSVIRGAIAAIIKELKIGYRNKTELNAECDKQAANLKNFLVQCNVYHCRGKKAPRWWKYHIRQHFVGYTLEDGDDHGDDGCDGAASDGDADAGGGERHQTGNEEKDEEEDNDEMNDEENGEEEENATPDDEVDAESDRRTSSLSKRPASADVTDRTKKRMGNGADKSESHGKTGRGGGSRHVAKRPACADEFANGASKRARGVVPDAGAQPEQAMGQWIRC